SFLEGLGRPTLSAEADSSGGPPDPRRKTARAIHPRSPQAEPPSNASARLPAYQTRANPEAGAAGSAFLAASFVPRCATSTVTGRHSLEDSMRHKLRKNATIGALALMCLATNAGAQAPAPPPLQVPNPTYISIPLEIAINRPAAEVWK